LLIDAGYARGYTAQADGQVESNHGQFEGIESEPLGLCAAQPILSEVPCTSPALVLLIAIPDHHAFAMAVHLAKLSNRTQG
jgi:hypothetical protein